MGEYLLGCIGRVSCVQGPGDVALHNLDLWMYKDIECLLRVQTSLCLQRVVFVALVLYAIFFHTVVIYTKLTDRFILLWPSDAIWRQRSGSTLGSGNGLLPDGTKP